MLKLKQIIPGKYCLSCEVCCRFIDKNAPLRPIFLTEEITPGIRPHIDKSSRVKLKPCERINACHFFNPKNNKCAIYLKRPFDCRLYPFAIMFDEKKERVVLGIDKKCPFAVDPTNHESIRNYFHYLVDLLEEKEIAYRIAENPLFISDFQDDITIFSSLDTLTKLIINNPEKNGFKRISLNDKPIFDTFFEKIEQPDSSCSFVNLYIWKDMNPVWWKQNGEALEILIETDSGYLDFNSLKKFPDYIYLTKDLAALMGNKYKHKRAGCNHFSKNYKFQHLPYSQNMKSECLKLFSKWAAERKKKFPDLYYHKLLKDSFSAHKLAIENYKTLGLIGHVIKIRGKICAYTFGFELRKDTFCILLEVCDLRFKGIAEFIFREFSKEMLRYRYVNAMDDSGLENLRIAKLSYHPIPNNLTL
ncbi:MAG: phosphatidylglycerol lysyltransferase domain-containing protein [Candidatus Omnitrophota bacterium]|nr:phosphatidylglycerol lysyltransferase domain-containing protein [Candidatus Omnitrophota bacterium]